MAARKNGRLAIRSAALSDPGRARRHNEDAYWLDPQGELFLLADGMGGQPAGEAASRLAIELFRKSMSYASSGEPDPPEALEQAILEVHARLRERAQQNLQFHGMGTTLLAAWQASPDALWIGHVGDCRAYRLRAGRLRQLTEEHTVYNQVRKSRHVSGEILDPALRNRLSQALGSSELVAPQVLKVKIEPGDRYLLCTDGLPGMLLEAEIQALLNEALGPDEICQGLVEAANQRGGKDNITVIVLICDKESD